jgi:DHA1 family multidrug resistance protein-like MFS transporter
MKSWKANFIALLLAETLAIMGFSLSSPVIPLFLEEEIGIVDPVKLKTWVGLINSCASLTLALFAPIWGHLADTYSRRAMLLRAMFGGAFVISFMTIANSPWQLLVLKTIQGCLTGTVAAATVLTASIAPAAQVALVLGLLQTGIAVGNSLGPLIGGVVSDFLGHRAAFFGTGLTLALAGLIVLKWVDNDKRPRPETKAAKLKLIPDVKPIAASPLLITMMLITFGTNAAVSIANPMLPLFVKELVKKASEVPEFIGSSTGIVFGVAAASTALAAVLVGKFSNRIGYWTTLIICLSAGAIMTLPQAFVVSVSQLMILKAFSSFFIGGTSPVINAIIAVSSKKEHQGTVYGFNSSVASAGAAIGPIIGSVVAMLSYRAVFPATAIILGVSFWLALRRRKLKA